MPDKLDYNITLIESKKHGNVTYNGILMIDVFDKVILIIDNDKDESLDMNISEKTGNIAKMKDGFNFLQHHNKPTGNRIKDIYSHVVLAAELKAAEDSKYEGSPGHNGELVISCLSRLIRMTNTLDDTIEIYVDHEPEPGQDEPLLSEVPGHNYLCYRRAS